MKKLRWVMDGDFWDVDFSTAKTLEGVARPVDHQECQRLLPLGASRGTKLSRPKQIHFFQSFMAAPFVPCYSSPRGFSLQRALTLPFGNDWFVTLLGQFDLQRFFSSIKKDGVECSESSWLQKIKRDIRNKYFFSLGFFSELLITPDDTLLVSCDTYGDTMETRKKAVFRHEFPHHDLTMEASSPALVIDECGTYWDVPLMMAIDLASIASDSGASYHLTMNHISGSAKQFGGNQTSAVPSALLPGLSLKGAFAFKKNIDIWRSQFEKPKENQPYDIFLSDPHISASGIIGAVATASVGDHSLKTQTEDEPQGFKHFRLRFLGEKSAFLADLFGSLSFSAQHGNFRKFYLDLTKLHARLDVPSGSKFLSAAARLGQDLYNSQDPTLEAIQALIPTTTLSFQQQIAGPFSFRMDSRVAVDLNSSQKWRVRLEKPVFAIEYALQVLFSAKAVAWYAPEQKQFMVELRFFET